MRRTVSVGLIRIMWIQSIMGNSDFLSEVNMNSAAIHLRADNGAENRITSVRSPSKNLEDSLVVLIYAEPSYMEISG